MDIDGPVSMVLATPLNPASELLGSPHQSQRLDIDGEGHEVAPSINPSPSGAPPSLLLLRSRSRSPNHSTESPYISSAHTPGGQPLSPPLVPPPSPPHPPAVLGGGDSVDSRHIALEPPLHIEANPVMEDGAGIGDNSGWGNAFMSPLPLSPILGTPKTPELSFGSSPESVDENGAEAQFTDPTSAPVASVDGVQTPILAGVGQGQLQETVAGTGTEAEPTVLDGQDDRGPSQLDAVEEHMRRVERELAATRGQLEVDEVERLRLQDEVDRLARQFNGLG
ncbi:hypothetical protein ONZ45_g17573 [Pleurotus djamor]|nr:hypothetical protein ONZ45_g17573 [Pleurotus djamor]